MVLTFNNYKRGNATVSDIEQVWDKGQLPNEVTDYFKDKITDVSIRSLHQADFNLFKDQLIVDNVVEVDDFVIIVSKTDRDWQVMFYKYQKGTNNRMGLAHQEVVFVKNNKNLLGIILDLMVEYSK